MNFNFFKNKKGFSLVECTVSLLLFSIITTSVLTVFSVSRNQIKIQNEKYKIDLLADNILSGFQGCNDWDSFSNLLKNDLKINTDGVQTEEETIPIGTDEGIGEYGFDTNNIPVPVPFEKIVVKDGYATFEDKDKNKLVSFAGDYLYNKLTENNDFEWKPNDCYNETKNRVSSRMILNGKAYPAFAVSSYDFTLEIDESNVSLKMGSMENSVTQPACDFDKFLLRNKYYLKCDKSIEISNFINYHYRFQVFNAEDNKEVKIDGKNLYYCISISSIDASLSCITDMQKFVAGTNDNDAYYFNLNNCTIKYYIGDECPSYSKFKTELKDGDKKFGGKWYFLSWFVYKNNGNIVPSCSSYSDGFDYYEYTAKEGVNSEIYYALNSDNTLLLFNSDGQLLFPFGGDTSEALDMLKREEPYCHFTAKTRCVYKEDTFDKLYRQGFMPQKTIDGVKFVDNHSSKGTSKIIFCSDGEEYIRFLYTDDKYDDFIKDKNTVLEINGRYADFYNYTKIYKANDGILKDFTDKDTLDFWKDASTEITNKLAQKFSDSSKKLQYHTERKSILATYCKYYTYTVTLKSLNKLIKITQNERILTINHNGQNLSFLETINATAEFNKTTNADSVKKTGDNGKNEVYKSSLPKSDRDNKVDSLDLYKPDNNGSNAKVLQEARELWNSKTANGTANGTKTNDKKPSDFETSNIKDWTLQSYTDPMLIISGVPSFTCESIDGPYKIAVENDEVFISGASNFEVVGATPVKKSGLSYEIISDEEAGEISAKTYYLTCTSGDTSLVIQVTYSDYTKKALSDDGKILEPKITVWSLKNSKLPSDIKQITNAQYKDYEYISYRKG